MQVKKIHLLPNELAEATILQHIAPSALTQLRTLKTFFVENIKPARRSIAKTKPEHAIDDITFHILDKDSSEQEIVKTLREITDAEIGMMSDAGCPGIADPGALLASIAQKNNIEVVPHVGPSSILLGLMASGFNGQSFAFQGYLPIDNALRSKKIKELENESLKKKCTQIFIETPYRNQQLFAELLKTCSDSTKICLAVNIHAEDQWIKTLSVKEWKKNQNLDMHKKPVVFLFLA